MGTFRSLYNKTFFIPPLLHESAVVFDLPKILFHLLLTCHGVAYCSSS